MKKWRCNISMRETRDFKDENENEFISIRQKYVLNESELEGDCEQGQ